MANTDLVSTSWSRIEAWLLANAPDRVRGFRPGASPAAIAELDRLLGLTMPDDVKAFYALHDGSEDVGLFPSSDPRGWDRMAFSPLPLEEVACHWQMMKELLEGGEFADLPTEPSTGISDGWWNTGWAPIASNGGGDYQCIDLTPAEGGTVGQVIGMWHDSEHREWIAPSLADYLRQLADGLESGKFAWAEGYGIVAVK